MKEVIALAHPRLLIGQDGFDRIRRNAQTAQGKKLYVRIKRDADHILTTEPQIIEKKDGRRMGDCHLSRWNVFSSLIAYIVENDSKYAARAIKEMMYLASMPTWNPDHYLDIAECCAQLAVGYDWLYHILSEEQRKLIAAALLDKAVAEAFRKEHEWIDGYNNWVQVCNGGMVMAAVAIAEDAPELLEKTVNRAVEKVPGIMKKSYSPFGAYPESPGYWGYGTLFNVYLIEAMESCFGTSFGLEDIPGWRNTTQYESAMICPDGGLYSYSDSGTSLNGFTFTPYLYMISKFNQPERYTPAFSKSFNEMLDCCDFAKNKEESDLPIAMLWVDALPAEPNENAELNYTSHNDSLSPITAHRSSNSIDAAYVGCRCGSASNSHGHMDAGSFFYMANGVRWAQDFGGPSYLLEKVVDLWNLSQDSQRWQVFKIGIRAHNILVFDGHNQTIAGRVTIESYDSDTQTTVMNLHDPYANEAKSVFRRCALSGKNLTVTDTIQGAKPGAQVDWQMQIDAEAQLEGNQVILSKNNQRLKIYTSNPEVKFELIDPKIFVQPWDDAPPKEWKILMLRHQVPKSGDLDIEVKLEPLD